MNRMQIVWALAVAAWVCFAGLAVICGALRVKFLEPRVGEQRAHVIGTLAFCLLLFALIRWFVLLTDVRGTLLLLEIGALWTFTTIGFELLFGRLVAKQPWERLIADYNIFRGRLWLLVLLTTSYGPLLAEALRP